MTSDLVSQAYADMWQDFGRDKSEKYNEWKFSLVNRAGLTNFVREESIISTVLSIPHDTLLDVGCASGRQVFRFASYCKQVCGVDIADTFIQECRKQQERLGCENVEFHVADFSSLPKQEFNVVTCCEVLEHVLDLPASIEALRCTVKSQGFLLVTVPHFNADGTWWGRLMRFLGLRSFHALKDFSLAGLRQHGDAHVREFSRQDLRGALEHHGFTVRRMFTVSHLDGPLGDRIITFFLDRAPWTRRIAVLKEHIAQKIFPGLGRHIVVLAQKQ